MEQVSLAGIIDMHVHTSPDLRERRYDDFQLCDAAVREGVRAIVIKSHNGSTAERAYLTNQYNKATHGQNGFTMFGGITLNASVGGLNPFAVENALKLGAKVVWLPTSSARNHLDKIHKPTDTCVEMVSDGKIVPELETIFEQIKEYDAVLATGHASPAEIEVIVKAAREFGVRKIVITHPEWWIVGMTQEQQIHLVNDYNVILERCFAQNKGVGAGHGYISNLPDNLEIIRTVGCHNVLISTDVGQVENPNWEDCYRIYLQYLLDNGIAQEDINYMSKVLPIKLLGI